MEIEKTKKDLMGHLKEQIDFLINSINQYDQGNHKEAKRMATTIRNLLHDTTESKSLIQLLEEKSMSFYDTSNNYAPDNNLFPFLGLIVLRVGKTAEYVAPLDDRPPSKYKNGKISFNDWWEKTVLVDKQNNKFSRKELILTVANKDGGAHVAKGLPENYHKLTRENSLNWKFQDGKGRESNIDGCELASIRQISHEVIKSLADKFPRLLK